MRGGAGFDLDLSADRARGHRSKGRRFESIPLVPRIAIAYTDSVPVHGVPIDGELGAVASAGAVHWRSQLRIVAPLAV